ncbi:MAG: 23S rRNA (adenine(2503)-C(2))-methyltransferase RlmN, partial [Candidatus Omnitrophota bacterium]
MHPRNDILNLSLDELKNILIDNSFSSFHARQIFSWIFKKNLCDFSQMSDLSANLRSFLEEKFTICSGKIKQFFTSQDGTKKFTILLADGNIIETVYIPAQGRATLCLSSQVGCRFNCRFCASSLYGWVRNLSCSEILGQILLVKRALYHKEITHIVFMGVGEPLDNFDNVEKAIEIINSKEAFNIGRRRITISTCGIIPAIRRLSNSNFQVELSVSLHAADDKRRALLMPINKKYPLAELITVLRQYQKQTNRQITFEYALIKDFNTGLEDALLLKKILGQLDYKINLIVLNPVGVTKFSPATKEEVKNFQMAL